MARCENGRTEPRRTVRDNLFADSGGFCQRPECGNFLFHTSSMRRITIAEVAHIIAVGESGPRNPSRPLNLDPNHYDNLILLCPNCHTLIDKDVKAYPVDTIVEWKIRHRETVQALFQTPRFDSRSEARKAIELPLAENRHIWEQYGPHGDNALNPESGKAEAWERESANRIVPNNEFVISLLEANKELLHQEEIATLAEFRVHATGFALRHLTSDPVPEVTTFPPEMEQMLQ